MTQFKKGWNAEAMISTLEAEATYGGGVAPIDNTNYTGMKWFTAERNWPDVVANDKDMVTGQEHGTDQYLIEKRTGFTLTAPQARPHQVAFALAAALGNISSAQDGATGAYTHTITPVAEGTELPSWAMVHKLGGIQRLYNGMKADSVTIRSTEAGFVECVLTCTGDGSRATDASAFVAAISEAPILANHASAWYESGANISIAGTRTQGAEDISSATPEDIKKELVSWEITFNNNPIMVPGHGGAGLLQDWNYGRRSVSLSLTIRFTDSTEMDHYLAQDALAFEFDAKGAVISGSTLYYGCNIIVPRFKIAEAPLHSAELDAHLTMTLTADVQNDGTNAAIITDVYNQQTAYLA